MGRTGSTGNVGGDPKRYPIDVAHVGNRDNDGQHGGGLRVLDELKLRIELFGYLIPRRCPLHVVAEVLGEERVLGIQI